LKVYIDTSVIISLADTLGMFHEQSAVFIKNLVKHRVECNVGSPFMVELGKIVEAKGTKRCLDIINSMNEAEIFLKNTGMKQVWELSQIYLVKKVLTERHLLDLFHYAAASLLGCTHLASWNSKQFNDKIVMKVNKANSERGLPSLIAGRPDYIMRQENFG
jgi:predicted nucleic acid-binding protein